MGHSNTDLQEKTVLMPEHDGGHVIIIIIIVIIITSSSSSPSSLCIIIINLTDGSGCLFLIIALFSIQNTFSLLFGFFKIKDINNIIIWQAVFFEVHALIYAKSGKLNRFFFHGSLIIWDRYVCEIQKQDLKKSIKTTIIIWDGLMTPNLILHGFLFVFLFIKGMAKTCHSMADEK